MTKMSSLNYMELCRLCLVKEKVSVPIFEGEGGERQIFDKIATCLPVKVSQDDKLPKKICSDCVYRVENSYQFWNTTSNSEKQLLEWVVSDDVKVDTKSNITMETEQLVLKEETIDHDQTAADVAKSLSRVEAVLTEETGQPGGGVSEEEEEEEDSDDGGGGGGGEDSNSEESGEEPPGKEEIESEEEEEEEEPYEELEPTTFVNVSLACDEAGPSGIQQTRQQTKQDSQASAASASATTENAEAPSTSAADPAASGFKIISVKTEGKSSSKWKPIRIPQDHNSLSKRKRSNKKEPWKCVSCLSSFTTFIRYKEHVMSHSGIAVMMVCDVCGENFSNPAGLIWHRRLHSTSREGRTTKKPASCEAPKPSNSSQKAPHPMVRDPRRRARGLKQHTCDICGYSSKSKSFVAMHRKMHYNEYKFYCRICSKGYNSVKLLHDHEFLHTGVKAFQCDQCGKRFSSRHNLESHKKLHIQDFVDNPNFYCEFCGKSFLYSKSLRRHRDIHLGENKFECDICGKMLNSKEYMKVHLRIHKGDKPYVCDMCGKAFVTNKHLTIHRRTHTGEKLYTCGVCNKSFTQVGYLTIHKRSHTGERPYHCDVCGKDFASKCQLNSHRRTHLSVK